MASIADFAPHVAVYAPGCPTITAEVHLRAAMAEFCAHTRCWRAVSVIPDMAPLSRVAIPVPPGAVVHAIDRAWLDECELQAHDFADFSPHELRGSGMPRYFTQAKPGEVTLIPRAESGQLRMSIFLKPSVSPSGNSTIPSGVYDPEVYLNVFSEAGTIVPGEHVVPDYLLEHHGPAIGLGAAARVLLVPGQTWTDPVAASMHRLAFEKAMRDLYGFNVIGQQRAPLRSRPSFF